jgi:ankyrin repeat protein
MDWYGRHMRRFALLGVCATGFATVFAASPHKNLCAESKLPLSFERVVALVSMEANPNCRFRNYETPLMHVARSTAISQEQAVRIIELLVKRGAQLEAVEENGRTVLQTTLLSHVGLFLRLGANINHADDDGNTILITAVRDHRNNKESIVKRLLDAKPNLNFKSSARCSALAIAEILDSHEWAKLLRIRGAVAPMADDLLHCTAELIATDAGDIDILNQKIVNYCHLAKNKNALDAKGRTVIVRLVEGSYHYNLNDNTVIRKLIQCGVNPNKADLGGVTPYHLIGFGHENIQIRDKHGRTVPMYATSFECSLFGNHGRGGATFLHDGEDPKVRAAAYKRRGLLNARDKSGLTLISYMRSRSEACAERYDALLDAGLRPSPSDKLFESIQNANTDELRSALVDRPTIDIVIPFQDSIRDSMRGALLYAIRRHSSIPDGDSLVPIVDMLIKAKADPNLTDGVGENALMVETRLNCREELIQLLVRAKTNLLHRNRFKQTVQDIAAFNSPECSATLAEAGVK